MFILEKPDLDSSCQIVPESEVKKIDLNLSVTGSKGTYLRFELKSSEDVCYHIYNTTSAGTKGFDEKSYMAAVKTLKSNSFNSFSTNLVERLTGYEDTLKNNEIDKAIK